MIWIRRNQVSRRNLTDDQRKMNAYRLGELEAEKSRREKAKLAVNAREVNAGRRESVDQIPVIASITKIAEPLKPAKQPAPKANPAPRIRAEVAKAAGVSERGVQQAGFVAKAAPELAAKVESGEMPLAAAVREVKRAEIVQKLESVEAKEAKALAGEYDVIVIDPPWPMQKIERDERPSGPQRRA